jgi:hypothetical protein
MATHYTLTLDRGDINRLALTEAQREVTDVTRRVLNRANVLTPVKTGNLRAHNQSRVRVEGLIAVGEVFNETTYALAVHDGTKAHTIRPVRKKALRFVVGGDVVFAKSANIPARRGRPWLLRALTEVALPQGYRLVTV